MDKLNHIPSYEDILNAHEVIKPAIHNTPVMTCQTINRMAGAEIYFKCENFQKVGAFKMRGASCAVAALSKNEKRKGIGTHSSGNHAQAVALAASLYNIRAHIVMPENASPVKRAAVQGYGAIIHTSGNRIEERESKMNEVIGQTGISFIHPYDDYNIIAGQATAAKELIDRIPDLDSIIAPVGGGGLLSGTSLISHYCNDKIKVYGAEPKLVDDAYRSFHSGVVETNDRIDTIADGLRTTLSNRTLEIIRRYVDEIITVKEETIVSAMRLIWERAKIVVETSGAVPLAAILENKNLFKNQRVGVILSGGNVDLGRLPF